MPRRPFLVTLPFLLAAAAPADVAGWEAARWGMSGGALVEVFGARLTTLSQPLDFGWGYAALALPDASVAGQRFTAYFQMDRLDDRLDQVLLERRDAAATPLAYRRLLANLEARFGPPSRICPEAPEGPRVLWRFPTTTIHAAFLDFRSPRLLYQNPNRDLDPRRPSDEDRMIAPRSLPRRLLLRFHDSRRRDLVPADCGSRP